MADIEDYIISNDIIGPSAVQATCTEWDLIGTDAQKTLDAMNISFAELFLSTSVACNSPAPQQSDCWENHYIIHGEPVLTNLYVDVQVALWRLFNSLFCGPKKTGIVTESITTRPPSGVASETQTYGTWYRTYIENVVVNVDVDYGTGAFLPEYWEEYKAACEAYACGTKKFLQSFMGDGFGEADIQDPSVPIFP